MDLEKILFIIPQKDFRDEEYFVPRQILEENGYAIETASIDLGDCISSAGETVTSGLSLAEIASDEGYLAIVFVGGSGTATLIGDQSALTLAKIFFEDNKLVCAICWAPAILAKSGIVYGHKLTAWSGARGDIEAAGGIYTGEDVTADGNIITAVGPAASTDFGNKIIEKLESNY